MSTVAGKIDVGIVGIGVYLPQSRASAKEIAMQTDGTWTEEAIIEKLGILQKTIPDDDISSGTQEMGALATLDLIENYDIDPKEIDVILCIGEEYKEYPLTTSALYIQDRIGAVNAYGVDVQNRCCSCIVAIKIAKDILISDDEIHNVLIVGGYRNGDLVDYMDAGSASLLFNLSAGGGAILLRKGHNKNLLLGSHIITDGSLSRTVGVKFGGICNPITVANLDYSKKSLTVMNLEKMRDRLNEVSMVNWFICVDKSLSKSGFTRKDVDYLAILHIKPSMHKLFLNTMGLSESNTVYLDNYGHMGQFDQILSLKLGLEQNKIKSGSIICMVAAGVGYAWAANIIKWG